MKVLYVLFLLCIAVVVFWLASSLIALPRWASLALAAGSAIALHARATERR